MAHPVSGLIHRVGWRVTISAHTHSHPDLIAAAGLVDDNEHAVRSDWAKFELVAPADPTQVAEYSTWQLRCNQEPPDWWHDSTVREIIEPCWRAMLVSEPRGIVLSGCWVITEAGRIDCLVHGLVVAAHPSANLAGVRWARVEATLANLAGANFDGALLRGANFEAANLTGASLRGANLRGATLEGAALYGANFEGANLIDANFRNANLRGANFEGAHRCTCCAVPAGWRLAEHAPAAPVARLTEGND